ncbi:hypothetical protein HDU82_001160, partial [Entophlyctis luteolus]
MEPAFQRGDLLLLSMFNTPVKVGDITVFKIEGKPVPIYLLTKGDNNPVDDRGLYNRNQLWVTQKEVVGRVTAYMPYIGMVTILLNDYPQLKAVLLGVLGLFVLITKEVCCPLRRVFRRRVLTVAARSENDWATKAKNLPNMRMMSRPCIPVLAARRALSGTAQSKPIELSALPYRQHLVVLQRPSTIWPKNVAAADPYIARLVRETAILDGVKVTASTSRLPGSVDDAEESADDSSNDILLLPDMLLARRVDAAAFPTLVRYLVETRLGVFDRTPLVARAIDIRRLPANTAVALVCTHAARDARCGACGGNILRALQDQVTDVNSVPAPVGTAVTAAAAATSTESTRHNLIALNSSHVGGHDWAANVIVYPQGDWYGNLGQSPEKIQSDALNIVEAMRTGRITMWANWRGRMNVDIDVMQRMLGSKSEKPQAPRGTCGSSSAAADAGAASQGAEDEKTAQVTYVLKNGERIIVDAQVTEFHPTDPLNPYFKDDQHQQRTSTLATVPKDSDDEVDFAFVLAQGERRLIRATVGESLMEVSRSAKIPTIEGVCGGNLECATCHVIVDKEHFERLPPASECEEDMLEYAIGRTDR